jgi:hypothetical protein
VDALETSEQQYGKAWADDLQTDPEQSRPAKKCGRPRKKSVKPVYVYSEESELASSLVFPNGPESYLSSKIGGGNDAGDLPNDDGEESYGEKLKIS